jgi:signal transduction histidine kinase
MTENTAGATRRARALPHPIVLVLLAGAYFLAGKLGLTLAAVHVSATSVWPGTGIALAALLSLGYRVWPAIFVGAFLVNATTAGSTLTSLGIATGNTLEAVLGAWLVNRFAHGPHPFDRAPDLFRYTGLVGIATTVSATLGVSSLVFTGYADPAAFGPIWLTWWLGDMGGALVVAPFLLLWGRDPRIRWHGRRALEGIALLASVAILGRIVFGWITPIQLGFALKFLCMPPLIWAAYRFGQRMATTAVLILAVMAMWGTLGRLGGDLDRWLLVLQVFTSVSAVTALALAAVVAERRRAELALRTTSDDLRGAMVHLEALSEAISHDLRTPIGSVVNYSGIVEQDYGPILGGPGLEMLRRMRVSAESAERLLNELSLFAEGAASEGTKASVDMTSLAREAYAEVVTGGGDVAGVRFQVHELPPAVGNPALLLRVFSNLLSNSVKYSRGRPHRHIEVDGRTGARENTYRVTDNGIGFPREQSEALFTPFKRLHHARATEGSGLGLAIVARIVHRHGGRVWAESDGVSGARFSFTLQNQEDGG